MTVFTLIAISLLGWCIAGAGGEDACKVSTPPTFSASYHVEGSIWIPYTELHEPFSGWFDDTNVRSRIDYYHGTVKTYQLEYYGAFGSSIKLVPVTTEEVLNNVQCLQINGTQTTPINVQHTLPDLTGFKCEGIENMDGQDAEKWTREEMQEEKLARYTMYILWEGDQAKPLRYEMRGYNSLLGSHFDHYYVDYQLYNASRPDGSVFDMPSGLRCHSFPGPGVDHVYTFNPMKEFIDGHQEHLEHSWTSYKHNHGKHYEGGEHLERKEAFRQNMRFIHSNNRAGLGYTLAANHLADRTGDELKALRGRRYSGENNGALGYSLNVRTGELPSQWNWRLWGAVTPVKDQSICGSCWAFATVGAVEGALYVKYGKLRRLSEQALVDCSWGYGNNGCDGGEDYRAYRWMMKHGGLPTNEDYGDYLGQDGNCQVEGKELWGEIDSYVNVTPWDELALRTAIYKVGPVALTIDASPRTFTFYSSGVYYEPKCKNKLDQLDHGVLGVGYGDINGQRYWLVKNSWSNLWGNDGYILISSRDNNCGVMTAPTYVNIS